MYKLKSLCLLIASLMICACSTSKPPLTLQTVPPLDSNLAEPCKTLAAPESADYDQWQLWLQNNVLRAYGECAARHRKIVQAWPK